MSSKFFSMIYQNPIIAAINDLNNIDIAIKSPCNVVFLLKGDISNIKSIVERFEAANKCVLVHIDLIEGFSKDAVSLKYFHDNIKPDGIITTKSNLIKIAKNNGIFIIQRLFALDSLSLASGVESLHSTKPDAVEILPGIIPKVIKEVHAGTRIPVIAGGLIRDKEDVIGSLNAGAVGISTSIKEIWYM
ncbi:MAG TPA: glycerol-3-phosphate responsive antiterminator [Clostridia bacterium]|nr:glycerol-3-phosphate responsive antiterminator [Clostridia bacterium]